MVGAVIELDRGPVDGPSGELGVPLRWWRWLGLAVAVIASGTVLVAADSSPGGGLVEVARVESASVVTMRVAGSMLFAVMLRGGPHLVGYRLTDGAQRWATPLAVGGADARFGPIDIVDGVVLLSMRSGLARLRTVAVDAGTGRELWRSDLSQVMGVGVAAGGTVVLGGYLNPDGSFGVAPYSGTDGPAQPLLLQGVQAYSGRLVWTRQVPTGWRTVLPVGGDSADPASWFVVIAPNGQATTVDVAAGQVRASAVVDAVAANRSNTPGGLVEVYGGQLVLVTTHAGGPALAAYRVSSLSLEWTAPLPPTDVFLWQCRPWLCVTYMNGIHAIGAGTGAQAWSMTNSGHGGWLAGWFYTEADQSHPDGGALIDPVSQCVVLNLGRWRIAAASAAGPVLLTAVVAGSTGAWLALLVAGPRVEVLGVVTAVPQAPCQVSDGYLACLTLNGELRIWRYR